MDDIDRWARLSKTWGPVATGGAFLFGYGIALTLPVNIEPPILGGSCGLAVMIAGLTTFWWKGFRDVLWTIRQREDDEWNRLVNADRRNPDGASESN